MKIENIVSQEITDDKLVITIDNKKRIFISSGEGTYIESVQQEARETLSENSRFIRALQSEIRTLKIEILRLKHKAGEKI